MIECIFTIDYEIFGNGEGSLKGLVYLPTKKLIDIFDNYNAPFVCFVEAAELDKIDEFNSDDYIDNVKDQIKNMYNKGIEIGLHIHPQWYNSIYDNKEWILDYSEYNLCNLPRDRINYIVSRSINYLRNIIDDEQYSPLSFRAGNWLLQPTKTTAAVLSDMGIKIDSSVFKGGLQSRHGLDYRDALKNGYYWRFRDDVNIDNPQGSIIEIPTYVRMVPFWKMLTKRRVGMQSKTHSSTKNTTHRITRLCDYLRMWYPLKFDFCRMTYDEMVETIEEVIKEDKKNPEGYRPLVAIGHTKDLFDYNSIDQFLYYLKNKGIRISTFNKIYKSHFL
jgi:peptidoglycan/xylan/chitin deacetylase (PgdA/CDA1 family)